jgi:hypothetical protein
MQGALSAVAMDIARLAFYLTGWYVPACYHWPPDQTVRRPRGGGSPRGQSEAMMILAAAFIWHLNCGDPPIPLKGMYDTAARCADRVHNEGVRADGCRDTPAGPRYGRKRHLSAWEPYKNCAAVRKVFKDCQCLSESSDQH